MPVRPSLRSPLLVVPVLAAAALASCRSGGGGDSRVVRSANADWSKYSVVLLEEAEVSTTAARNEQVDATLQELKGIAETSLRSAFESTKRFEKVTTNPAEAVPGKTLVCRCKMVVNFGNTALRVMVGFGAGRSGLQMTPELHDAGSNELLLSYAGWGGAIGGWGAQVVEKMRVDAMRIANHFANLIPRKP